MIVFGEFLVVRGFVSARVIAEAEARRKATRIPIGQVAMRAKLLTAKQVFDVLAHQRRTRQMFGQAAVALGLMRTRDVDTLLRAQYGTMIPLEEVLVVMGATSRETMGRALEEFHRLTPLPRTPPRPTKRVRSIA